MLKSRRNVIIAAIIVEIILIAIIIGAGILLYGQNKPRIVLWFILMYIFCHLYVFIQSRIQKRSQHKKNVQSQ
jgi:ABC-type multidrug transport system permease subunit